MGFLCRGAVDLGCSWPSAWCFLSLHYTSVWGSRSAQRLLPPFTDFSVGFTKPGPAKGDSHLLAAVHPSALPAACPRHLQSKNCVGWRALWSEALGPAASPSRSGRQIPLLSISEFRFTSGCCLFPLFVPSWVLLALVCRLPLLCVLFSLPPSSVTASSRKGLSLAGFGSPETLALLEPTLQLFLPGYWFLAFCHPGYLLFF